MSPSGIKGFAIWWSGSESKLDWPVPDFSTVCRRQKTLRVELSYQPSKSPLQLLTDSTGIKFLGESEWKRKKHGAEYRRKWHKVHLGIDAQTLEIRAIEVTSNVIGVRRCCPSCRLRFPATNPSRAPVLMAPTTPATAWTPLRSGKRWH